MAKHRKNSVIVLPQDMLKSKVWLSLSGTATHVFLLFRTKCRWERLQGKKHRGKEPDLANNGEIVFTYEEAWKKYGISGPRFKRAIDKLISKGFIDVAATGAGTFKVVTLYRVSERWRLYGTPDFVQTKRPKRSSGYPGFRKGNQLWQRRQKKISTDTLVHSAMNENISGSIIAMYNTISGERIKKLYKFNGCNWICAQIA